MAAWREYMEAERLSLVTPAVEALPGGPAGNAGCMRLVHDQNFRQGENVLADFPAFFTGQDWKRAKDLFVRFAWDRQGLWVTLKEEHTDMAARRKRWTDFAGGTSDSFTLRVYALLPDGKTVRNWQIHSRGRSAETQDVQILGRQHIQDAMFRLYHAGIARHTEWKDGYRTAYRIPWRDLGGFPGVGKKIRLNVTANPYIARNTQYT